MNQLHFDIKVQNKINEAKVRMNFLYRIAMSKRC